jgi:hypothetical protein
MRRSLLVAVAVASCLGWGCVSSPLSGEWRVFADVNPNGGLWFNQVYSVLEADYSVGELTFAATAVNRNSFLDLYADVYGTLGPFALASHVSFNPDVGYWEGETEFQLFTTALWLDVAGIETYALFIVDGGHFWNYTSPNAQGTGLNLGASGAAGDLLFGVDVSWNTTGAFAVLPSSWSWETIPYCDKAIMTAAGFIGYDYEPGEKFQWTSPDNYGLPWPAGPWGVRTDGCSAFFDRVYVSLYYPFACLGVGAQLSVSGSSGFRWANFWVANVDIGIPWLKIREMDVLFTLTEKSISFFDFDLALSDVCFKPFFYLDIQDSYTLSAIGLLGLTMEYSWNGVTLKAGTIFDDDLALYDPQSGIYGVVFDQYGNRFPWADPEIYPTPAFFRMEDYDEYLAILVDGESCCGGNYTFSVFNWFDVDDDHGLPAGIFGWQELVLSASVGVSKNLTFKTGVSVLTSGLNWMRFGIDLIW